MMDFAIHLEASDPARNIRRSYSIAAGQDLFGDWIVALNYGRIGAKGHTKTVQVADEAAAYSYVRKCLCKRKSAPKRIGIDYKVKGIVGAWDDIQWDMEDLAVA
ncbi:WGR domain-containing protein (plasmid) [Methylococcus sp. EFPC2]|nr:WGR domain-containing protein [Methylococcus sp. EFPC2]